MQFVYHYFEEENVGRFFFYFELGARIFCEWNKLNILIVKSLDRVAF